MIVLDARTATPHYPGVGRYTRELARALSAVAELTLLVNPLQSGVEANVTEAIENLRNRLTALLCLAHQLPLPDAYRNVKFPAINDGARATLFHVAAPEQDEDAEDDG